MTLTLNIELLSPLHLGSGRGDVVVDAEIVHDEYGMPYFPAKRVRGLLYESAMEVVEMSECCGQPLVSRDVVEKLFGKTESATELYVHDLTLQDYEALRQQWAYLQRKYQNIISAQDVLNSYTSLRYQTKIDPETGSAADGSLHNMRVLDSGITFRGKLELLHADDAQIKALTLAVANLRYAGAKRNRGFGEIKCTLFNAGVKCDVVKVIGG